MKDIGIGIVGGGYMGKAHSVAMLAVGAVFDTVLRPRLEMICTTSDDGAAAKARQFGFTRSTADWRKLVTDPKVEAVVIASPQATHCDIALASFELGKPVFCEKPLALSLATGININLNVATATATAKAERAALRRKLHSDSAIFAARIQFYLRHQRGQQLGNEGQQSARVVQGSPRHTSDGSCSTSTARPVASVAGARTATR